MKRIFITNDDGYDAPGLHALIDALRPLGQITVVAPTLEKSASGHSLTLTRPLRFIEVDDDFYKLDDGTPTDCVFLGLNKLYGDDIRPDLVVSGINRGANMGEDITYSGTAAAAMEAVLQGAPAVAFSQVCEGHCDTVDYTLAARTAADIVRRILDAGFPLPSRQFLNVNIPPLPATATPQMQVTREGRRAYGNHAETHRNPRGIEYYWIGLPRLDWIPDAGEAMTDFEAIERGAISLTPVQLDLTAYKQIEPLKAWLS